MDNIIGEDKLFSRGRVINLEKGEVLHDIHDKCRSIGKVNRGKMRLSRILTSGKEIVLKEFSPGELFAELIVFSGEYYPGRILASVDSEVVEVEYALLLEYLEEREALVSFITGISRKLTHLTNTIEIMSMKTVEQKIAYYLLTIEEANLSGTFNSINPDRPFSVTGFAEKLGSSREAVSRAISGMAASGMLVKESNGIRIINRPLLENLL